MEIALCASIGVNYNENVRIQRQRRANCKLVTLIRFPSPLLSMKYIQIKIIYIFIPSKSVLLVQLQKCQKKIVKFSVKYIQHFKTPPSLKNNLLFFWQLYYIKYITTCISKKNDTYPLFQKQHQGDFINRYIHSFSQDVFVIYETQKKNWDDLHIHLFRQMFAYS